MTATNLEIVYDKIVEIMQELTGTGQPFAAVYAYPNASAEVFPFAIVDVERGSQSDEASNKKILKQNFIIRCLFRQKSTEAATEQRIRAMGLVVEKFTESGRADYLENTVHAMDIVSIDPFVVSGSDEPIFGFDMILQCQMSMTVE